MIRGQYMGEDVKKLDAREFTSEQGAIQTGKLGKVLLNQSNIVHIKSYKAMTNNDAIETPLYIYNPKYGVYEGLTTNGNMALNRLVYRFLDMYDKEISNGKLNEVACYMKANAPILPPIERNIIAFDNALYDVDNNEVLTKSPDIVTTSRINGVTYDPSQTESKILDEFMYTLFGGHDDDADMMRFIYEVIGYCFVNNTFAQKFFILYGTGGNGKSTFLNLLTMLLTDKNVSTISLFDIDGNKFRLAEIVGKFANLGDDIDNGAILNTANIKKIVTGDPIMIERKGVNAYSYKPHAKLFFSCNSIPNIYDTSTGMNDRLVIIPMLNRIRNSHLASPNIVKDIVNSGGLTVLLNRALEGLQRLRLQGDFTIPPRVNDLTRQYIEENNQIAQFVHDVDNGEVERGYTYFNDAKIDDVYLHNISDVSSKTLYELYSQWAKENGYRPMSKRSFGTEMKNLGYSNENKKRFGTQNPLHYWS